jgi:hypothetical protein
LPPRSPRPFRLPDRSGFPVIPAFRMLQLSGRLGYFPIIPINTNKKQFKKDKRSAQFAYYLLFNKSPSNFVVLAETETFLNKN